MKLVLVLVAVLWTECSGMTDLGSCTTVTDQQVCGDVTVDPNGCSASVGWGDLYFSWNCNGEDLQCHRRCSDRLEQPDDCVGIETRCNLHDSHGVCEEFEGDCGFGSRNVTWDCGQLGLVGCPQLCCCTGCAPTDSPIPPAQVCDDFYDELACARCTDGMHRDIRVPGSCFIMVTSVQNWDTARDNCINDYGGWLIELTSQWRFDMALEMQEHGPLIQSWVGGHSDDNDYTLRQWVTHSNPPVLIDGSMWATGQPNDISSERCIIIRYQTGKNGLHDGGCSFTSSYICERYLLP